MQKHAMTRRQALGGMGFALAATLPGAAVSQKAGDKEQAMDSEMRIRTQYYQHFDADYALEVPEEGFGGWKTEELVFSRKHTAVVLMHAWAAGKTCEEFPGWWRCVPYIPRSNAILRDVIPDLLTSVRSSGLPLFHVVGGGDYYKSLPGYLHAVALGGGPLPKPEQVEPDPTRQALDAFKAEHSFVGGWNKADVKRGFAQLDFPAVARPLDGEGVAENGRQLFALCKERGINHLVYCGFAINWCLLLSPGGMADMQQYGLMCSALRQATTAVESKESARGERAKELALWRVALGFGFVFDVEDFKAGIRPA